VKGKRRVNRRKTQS